MYCSFWRKLTLFSYHHLCSEDLIKICSTATAHTHKPLLQDDIKLELMLNHFMPPILQQEVVIGNLHDDILKRIHKYAF